MLKIGRIYTKSPLKKYYHSSGKGVYGHKLSLSGRKEFQIPVEDDVNRSANANLYRAITAFREHGHRTAKINLLAEEESSNENFASASELNLKRYNLDENQLISPKGLIYLNNNNSEQLTVKDVIEKINCIYSNQIGYEFMHIESEAEREWFAQKIESSFSETISNEYKIQIALGMSKFQNFDKFLGAKFPTVKRYGGEGCESIYTFFMELFKSSTRLSVDSIILGMAHRGRLNLLTELLKFPPVRMFQKMKGKPEFPPEARCTGDVLSHLYDTVDLDIDGKNIHFSLLPNPSHLEAVNAMAVGKCRAKQKTLQDYDYNSNTDKNDSSRVLCLQIHGDAAISGQGINQEILGFANVPHFRVSGSLHLITNNQIGFTTPQERGRSSRYSSDIAKFIGCPVIHVNGDDIEGVVKATRLAMDYRQNFHKDVFIDLICFRRWGHNEMDDPTFTNPIIYNKIHQRKSIPDRYNEKLIGDGILSQEQIDEEISKHNKILNDNLNQIESYVPPKTYLNNLWSDIVQGSDQISTWDTGYDLTNLEYIGYKSTQYPKDFNVHSHLEKTFVNARINKIDSRNNIDWATAESLAFGSLLLQDFSIRLSGEDIGRGTFSHRHMMLVDQKSGDIHIPLNSLVKNQSNCLELANSTLSEEAVLAFEYGYSLENPKNLVIWEAQFGDFFNGAQIIIDTMITSGETKWMLESGIVILLPHGMDGAGPEHSSCRIERFLQMTDSNESDKADGDYNSFQVSNPTTPAQYFHLLRRQMIRDFRKPLVIIAPKVLLRLSKATSKLEEMGPNTFFMPVLGDDEVQSSSVKKVILVSGKHYYNLLQKREDLNRKDIAIVRVESLCPFPAQELQNEIKKYPNAKDFIWSQEEHKNLGAWTYIKPRFENFIGKSLKYVGREVLATSAVGIGQIHAKENAKILNDTFMY